MTASKRLNNELMNKIILLILVFSLFASTNHTIAKDHRNSPTNKDILFIAQWDVGLSSPLRVVVNEKEDINTKLLIRDLVIYKKLGPDDIKIFSFKTPDVPVSIGQTKDVGGRLVTVWVSGSSYHIYVYSIFSNKIIQVLNTGSRAFPEIIYNDQGDEVIIVTGRIHEKESEIYHWQNNKYNLGKKVPYPERFNNIKSRVTH